MSAWYVYSDRGPHRGPLSTDALVDEVARGRLRPDARIASTLGAPEWRRIADVPELAAHVPARPMPADCYRLVDGAFTRTARGTPEFGATMLMMGTRRAAE